MYSQNILNHYGSKLDIKLDSSELYDYELSKTDNDYDYEVLNLNTPITYSTLIVDSNCLISSLDDIKPWVNEIDTHIVTDNCDFTIKKRTEKGWTLNFLFNRNSLDWISGGTFYYWGISGETNQKNYLDNNLSFSFTEDGRIKWSAVHYSGNCGVSGFTGSTYISSGQTSVLCTGGTSNDFLITITFDRNRYYTTDCDVLNQGGSNDLITGWTVTNVLDVITGATEDFTLIEELNQRWLRERNNRLGTLKIYLNGRPIYKHRDWEEIIPSLRISENQIIQKWGGGTSESGDLHNNEFNFSLKRIQYFEEPLNFVRTYFHYLVSMKPYYNIYECDGSGIENPELFIDAVLTEDGDFITTEDGDILIF